MSCQTIVVHVDQSRHAEARIRHAARLAARDGAHLVGSAFSGISRHVEAGVEIIAAQAAERQRGGEEALSCFDTIARSEGVASYERRFAHDEPAGGLILQAPYADLVVLSQTDPDDPAAAHLAGPLPEQVLVGCARPVLLIPSAAHDAAIGSKVVVAWDGSLEAARAVYCALPLLRQAQAVALVLFAPAGAAGRDPGADLALYLARHGVPCAVHADPLPIDAGEALLSRAADLAADLMVMGAYGHSRLRETLLGGVTDTVLARMTMPVFLAH